MWLLPNTDVAGAAETAQNIQSRGGGILGFLLSHPNGAALLEQMPASFREAMQIGTDNTMMSRNISGMTDDRRVSKLSRPWMRQPLEECFGLLSSVENQL